MNKIQAQALLKKFDQGKASKDEIKLLERWYIEESKVQNNDPEPVDYSRIQSEMWNNIQRLKQLKTRLLWPRVAAAASVIICLSIGSYFFLNRQKSEQLAVEKAVQLSPGGNKAILTLANGETIALSTAKNGKLIQQGSVAITKVADGRIVYHTDLNSDTKENVLKNTTYNTVTTPRAGQYNLTLADGTKVWLNAASSIKYPTAFVGSDRQVELTGEAYFEVAHNRLKPFRVKSHGQTVEVLGTHFNISAYADESAVRTDLLEGSVKVLTRAKTALLKPGQEAVFTALNSTISVKEADTGMSIAWKNGIFSFKKAELPAVMRQIARWYDLDVIYEGPVPSTAITGTVDRNVNASQFFQILKDLDIHFRITGNKITITQK